MEERLHRVIADLKAIQQSLEDSERQADSAISELHNEALEDVRAMVDKVRKLLWSYHLANTRERQGKDKVLEIYCAQRVIDQLRAHRNRVPRSASV